MRPLLSTALRCEDERLWVLDQERLPGEENWLAADSPQAMAEMIVALKIRGAPLIGVGAALSLGLFARKGAAGAAFDAAALLLRNARPTAVNLMMAVDRVWKAADPWATAVALFDEDVSLCDALARHGVELVEDGDRILTHCNTGGLATAGVGTALGVIRHAHESGKKIHVYVDETRPLLQGARLTAWELEKLGIPYTLLCDNAAASLMALGKVSKIFVGADRIARNGDFANKIGTYSLAVLAQYHGIAFYPVAPLTTVDAKCPSGEAIPVEMRRPEEVRGVRGSFGSVGWSPKECAVYNPAFDITPAKLVTALVLNTGVLSPHSLSAHLPQD